MERSIREGEASEPAVKLVMSREEPDPNIDEIAKEEASDDDPTDADAFDLSLCRPRPRVEAPYLAVV